MGMFLMVFLIGVGKNEGHAVQCVLAPSYRLMKQQWLWAKRIKPAP